MVFRHGGSEASITFMGYFATHLGGVAAPLRPGEPPISGLRFAHASDDGSGVASLSFVASKCRFAGLVRAWCGAGA